MRLGLDDGRGKAAAIAAALVFVVLATGTFVVWERDYRKASANNPGLECPAVVPARHRVPFAARGVHRVALIGDSIMFEASCSIADSLAGVGIRTSRHAVSGSGLLNGIVDWMAQTKRILRDEHPDVVVAIFVGNYPAPFVRDASGRIVTEDSAAFFAAWQQRATQLSDEVRAAGAQMYWVSPPPIGLPPLNRARRLFDGYATIPHVHALDSGKSLAGPAGQEVMQMRTCGRTRTVRIFDAVHLSDDGARIYGQQI